MAKGSTLPEMLTWDDLALCFDGLQAGVAFFEPEQGLAYANAPWREIFRSLNLDPGDESGSIRTVLGALDDAAKIDRGPYRDVEDWVARCCGSDDVEPVEMRVADGRWFMFRVWSRPGGGRYVICVDVSERRRNQIRLEDVLSIVSSAFAFWDGDDRLVACNARFREFFANRDVPVEIGDSFAELIDRAVDKKLFDMPLGEDEWRSDRLEKHKRSFFQENLTTRDGQDISLKEHRTGDGGSATTFSDVTAIRAKEREILYWESAVERAKSALTETRTQMHDQAQSLFGLGRELDELETKAAQADTALTTFMRSMSMEIRTPLHSIIGFAELISTELYGPIGDQRYREYADLIHHSGNYLLELVMRILTISKIQSGRYDLELSDEDVTPILHRAQNALRAKAHEKAITIDVQVEPNLPPAHVDPQAMQVILTELLANAIEFTPEGGAIAVWAERIGSSASIQVADCGIGIPEEEQDRVLLPFETGRTMRKEDYARGGLGLTLARELTELQGGKLTVNSIEGEGTTVLLEMPLAASAVQKNAAVG